MRRGLSDKWVVLAETGHVDPDSLKIKLAGTEFSDLEIKDKLGDKLKDIFKR